MSAPEFGQRAAHGAEKAPKPSQKCREISSSEISTNNSAPSAVVVQTFPRERMRELFRHDEFVGQPPRNC